MWSAHHLIVMPFRCYNFNSVWNWNFCSSLSASTCLTHDKLFRFRSGQEVTQEVTAQPLLLFVNELWEFIFTSVMLVMCKQPSGRWDNGNKAHLLCCKVERLLGNRVLKRLTWSLSAAPADLQARQFLFKCWEFTLDEVKQAVDLNHEKQPAAQRVLSLATVEKKQKKKRLKNFTASFLPPVWDIQSIPAAKWHTCNASKNSKH